MNERDSYENRTFVIESIQKISIELAEITLLLVNQFGKIRVHTSRFHKTNITEQEIEKFVGCKVDAVIEWIGFGEPKKIDGKEKVVHQGTPPEFIKGQILCIKEIQLITGLLQISCMSLNSSFSTACNCLEQASFQPFTCRSYSLYPSEDFL